VTGSPKAQGRGSTARRRTPRIVALLIIAGLHVVGAVLLLAHRDDVAVHKVAAITLRAVPIVPVVPVATPLLSVTAIAPSVPAPVFAVDDALAAPRSCDIAGTVGEALGRDPVVVAALAPVAAEPQRTLMLWDDGWRDLPGRGRLIAVVITVVGGARADCLDEAQTGPRLVTVPVAATALTLAVGSGVWTWRALLSADRSGLARPNVAGRPQK